MVLWCLCTNNLEFVSKRFIVCFCYYCQGKIPLIGSGGIGSGEDAYRKIRAGATLVQLYTAFAYGGPALIPQMKVSYS